MPEEWVYGGLDKNMVHSHVRFCLDMKVIMAFCKNCISGKKIFCQKTSGPIRMLDSLSYNISQKSRSIKLNFFMWLDIHKNSKFTQPFQVGVFRHAWTYPNWCQMLGQLDLKNDLSHKYDFLCVVRDA